METNVHLKINVHIFVSSWLKVFFFLFLFNKNVDKAGLMIVLSTVESNAALGKGSGWVLPFAATQVVGSSFCWDLFGCGACPMTACVWGERATESLPGEQKDSVSDLHDPSFYSSSSSFQCSISNNRKVNGHSMKNMVEDSSRNGDAFKYTVSWVVLQSTPNTFAFTVTSCEKKHRWTLPIRHTERLPAFDSLVPPNVWARVGHLFLLRS